jgi:hypothetical protein
MDRHFTIYDGTDIIEEGAHEVSWEQVRRERNQALKDSDWRAGKDVVLSNDWKEFRDLLRTLPQRFDDPNDAADAFPEAPSDE